VKKTEQGQRHVQQTLKHRKVLMPWQQQEEEKEEEEEEGRMKMQLMVKLLLELENQQTGSSKECQWT
jgi:hypothetical protein